MNALQLRAIAAGALFAIWPILMNRTGLSGGVSAAVFGAGQAFIVLPFALYEYAHSVRGVGGIDLKMTTVVFVAGACLAAGSGLLFFNGALAKAAKEEVGALVIIMLIAEIFVSAICMAFAAGGITLSKAIGVVAAILAALLLGK